MSGNGKLNPWIFVVVTGVLAILFAVFGLQQQTEELAVKAELGQARLEIEVTKNRAVALQKLAIEKVKNVEAREKVLIGKLEECMKGKKR